MENPTVSVVLGSYNRRAFLKATLESVRRNGMPFPYEIIVVDGGSTDGTLGYLMRQKDVITIVQHNRGTFRGKPLERRSWGYFMNLGFKAAQGKYILMISDDCLLVQGAVKNGVSLFEKYLAEGYKVGAMAFYWREWPDQKDYWVGTTLGDNLFVNHGLYLRQAVQEVGWIDEKTYFFYHADGDLCLKLWQRGYVVVDSPDSYVEHFSYANHKARKDNVEKQQEDWRVYRERWEEVFRKQAEYPQGRFIRQSYYDVHQTYKSFPWISRVMLFITRFRSYLSSMIHKGR